MITSQTILSIPDSEFSILAFTEDLHIGPRIGDIDILMEITLNPNVRKFLTDDEISKQFEKFVKLIYYRFPRFRENFTITSRRINMNLAKPRILYIAKYT